jgi:enamine deaminase RidA (YjgF/YER057c/UK114 family)
MRAIFAKIRRRGSFVNVPAWPGHFKIEIDCVAAVL